MVWSDLIVQGMAEGSSAVSALEAAIIHGLRQLRARYLQRGGRAAEGDTSTGDTDSPLSSLPVSDRQSGAAQFTSDPCTGVH